MNLYVQLISHRSTPLFVSEILSCILPGNYRVLPGNYRISYLFSDRGKFGLTAPLLGPNYRYDLPEITGGTYRVC